MIAWTRAARVRPRCRRLGKPLAGAVKQDEFAIVLTESAIVRTNGMSHAGRGLQWYHGRAPRLWWGL